MKIFLLGYMGSGKSTLAKKIAKMIAIPFIDLDQQIERSQGKSIATIFKEEGESTFRKIEKKELLEQCSNEDFVMALGGGTPCDQDNLDLILNKGISVYLKMNVAALESRLSQSKQERPLLLGKNEEELNTFINEQLLEREKYYSQANITVDAIQADHVGLKKLVEAIKLIAGK